MRLIGPSLIYAVLFTILFALVGGSNQVLSQKFWGITCEQNFSNGMRDGALIVILFNIAYLPVMVIGAAYSLWIYGADYGQAILILVYTIPVYFIICGVLGEKVSSFFYIDQESEPPDDFRENTFTCPHCGARYYYGERPPGSNTIICQNCNQMFNV